MDIQLQELIGKIKKDGIESAVAESASIKKQAEADAARVIADAKKEAARIIEQAKADAVRSEKAGIAAVEQASRNTILAFKGEIQALLDKIVTKEVAKAYSADIIKTVLPEIVKGWANGKDGEGGIEVLLAEKNLAEVEGSLKAQLASAISGGVTFKAARGLEGGFRISEKDGAAYYDFSAEQVAAAFSAYLNPSLAAALKDAAK
jgi:V/A-type H+-transporting ATPase subunit E